MHDKLIRLQVQLQKTECCYVPSRRHIEAILSLWPWIEQSGANSVLDCACGERPGPLGTLLKEKGVSSVGVDLLDQSADVRGDVHDLPFEDNSFDLVVSREGPEHFLMPYLAIAEMIRVTRRWLIVCVPSDSPRCEESPGHLYVMGRQGWENVFRRLGLVVYAFAEFDVTDDISRPQMEWQWLLAAKKDGLP